MMWLYKEQMGARMYAMDWGGGRKILTGAPLAVLLLLTGCGDPEAEANKKVVEASQALSAVKESGSAKEHIAALEKAEKLLSSITAEQPGTRVAVDIVADNPISRKAEALVEDGVGLVELYAGLGMDDRRNAIATLTLETALIRVPERGLIHVVHHCDLICARQSKAQIQRIVMMLDRDYLHSRQRRGELGVALMKTDRVEDGALLYAGNVDALDPDELAKLFAKPLDLAFVQDRTAVKAKPTTRIELEIERYKQLADAYEADSIREIVRLASLIEDRDERAYFLGVALMAVLNKS